MLALAGREQEAAQLLGQLRACGGLTAAELAADEDLRSFHDRPWMVQLMSA